MSAIPSPQRCTDPHDCGRYLPHHPECCPCAQGMTERWADAANRLLNVAEAAIDTLGKAAQYGTTEDGDTSAYILPKGTVHRLLGAVMGAGFSAALPVHGKTLTDHPEDQPASSRDGSQS